MVAVRLAALEEVAAHQASVAVASAVTHLGY